MFKINFSLLLLYVLYLVMLTSVPKAFSQSSSENPDPETLFDFWAGRWEVSWQEADGTTGRGVNIVEKILDGTVIRENFRITEGRNEGFKGTSISVYHRGTESWRQAWADNRGGYYDFKGSLEGEKRIFQTDVRELADGRQLIQRMIFYDISEHSLTWDWKSSEDGGETWSLNWRIYYRRANQ